MEKPGEITHSSSEVAENPQLERHKHKLIDYYSSGDERAVFSRSLEEEAEDTTFEDRRRLVLQGLRDDGDYYRNLDLRLLQRMNRGNRSDDAIMQGVKNSLRQERILALATDLEWENADAVSVEQLNQFWTKFPTPIEFEPHAEWFLGEIEKGNDVKKREEYAQAMDEFCHGVYGKQYEYYQAMKALREEAKEEAPTMDSSAQYERPATQKRGLFERLGKLVTRGEKAPLFAEYGIEMLNKGELIGAPKRENEDAVYADPENGMFGVFDGAGGVKGGARASGLASDVIETIMNEKKGSKQKMPEKAADLAEMLTKANETVLYDKEAGISTAALGRIVAGVGGKRLIWAAAGDSRIYLVRDGKAMQITRDEGIENRIWNYLGKEDMKVEQTGTLPLKKGDNVVFCSDGITGDFEEDFIPDEEFAAIVRHAKSAEEASKALVQRATKKDDRTAIVVRV